MTCSYEGCKSPLESRKFIQIDGSSEAGGQDWTELAGSVLCGTCYDQFRLRGTLERTQHHSKPLPASGRRCGYEGCKSPLESRKFIQIDGSSEAGGQDWTELAGSVLCGTCYDQFRLRGTLERTQHHSKPLPASGRRCGYEGCKSPLESRKFIQIDGSSEAGGQDWTELAGSVLCNTCYSQFRLKGSLERTQHLHNPLPASGRRCGYEGCKSPLESRQFYQIDGSSEAGGQDWTELAGGVLCETCYNQFRLKGSLERTQHLHKPLPGSGRRCGYEGCKSPLESRKFIQIDGSSEAGGQDWTELAGGVLCHTCYSQFRKRGTLDRTQHHPKPLPGSGRRCGYEGCKSPLESRKFIQIDGSSEAGGQDWTELAGSVLCEGCYNQFRLKGSLDRTQHHSKPLPASGRRCGYEGCKSPLESRKYYQIDGSSEAGGQDWTELAGGVLCEGCYNRFRLRGRLERTVKQQEPHGDIAQQHAANTSSSSSSSKRKRESRPHEDVVKEEKEEEKEEEEEEEEEYDGHLEECFMCFGSGNRMCIVPCGHSICGGCVEEGKFKRSKTRPFSSCPVCREEMCKPWVMDGELWVELGGTPFDP